MFGKIDLNENRFFFKAEDIYMKVLDVSNFISDSFGIRSWYKRLAYFNAAGGINTNYIRGDLMILNDHINFMEEASSTSI